MRDYEGDLNGFAFLSFTKKISKDLLSLFFLCVYSCGIATFFIDISFVIIWFDENLICFSFMELEIVQVLVFFMKGILFYNCWRMLKGESY